MKQKGLSQILYLIIAASVLMIAALSLVFMLDEGLAGIIDFGGDANIQGCEAALEAACADGATSVSTPSACKTTDAEGEEEVIQDAKEYGDVDSMRCEAIGDGSTVDSGTDTSGS
ncbi:MAG: hypothetical protein ACLFTA_02050 [Candidatus Nanohaloarchaea archaeon]